MIVKMGTSVPGSRLGNRFTVPRSEEIIFNLSNVRESFRRDSNKACVCHRCEHPCAYACVCAYFTSVN